MQGPARVLIVGRSSGQDSQLADLLRANGYESYAGDIEEGAAEVSGSRRPDVVILNMQSAQGRDDQRAFLALAKTLKQSTLSSHMRIMLVGADSALQLDDAATHIDDLLIGPVKPVQICHRLGVLLRLNTMHEELVRRLSTSAKYGLDAPEIAAPPRDIDNPTILVLGDALDFGSIEQALARRATLVGALSSATATDYLGRRPFDAVLISAGSDADSYLPFVKDIRRNSRLYNLPIVLLAEPNGIGDEALIYESGITDILMKPFSAQELEVRIDTLVREVRFRDSLKHIYGQAKHFATSDALTGLYSRGFLLEHLSTVIADAERTSQSFSLAALSIRNMPEINDMLGFAAGDRIIRQVGETIGLLIRGEDLAARYSGSKFAVILPDTISDRASIAINRINGVVSHTEFAVEGHHQPISVTLAPRIVGFEPGDTPETLLDRAWSSDLKVAA
ncbi:MAG: diguanylate cyclase [Hyphomicrobiales bacterium]|nr:diguanylate cyclase [Hyphomicrobiales bacterium]